MNNVPPRVRTVYATNAVIGKFGVGGPGAFLLQELLEGFAPACAISRGYEGPPLPPDCLHTVPPPRWVRMLQGTRFGRFAVRGQDVERLEFDRVCSRLAPRCDLAVVENSTSLRTIHRLKGEGTRIVLKYNNHPFAQIRADVEEERRRWGGPPFFVTDELVQGTREECREADLVVAMSASVLANLADDGVAPEKLRRARYGIDAQRFRPVTGTKSGFVVAFVGWLALHKGFPYLVEAFRDAAIPGSELLLHGGTGIAHHHELVERLRGKANVRVVRGPVEETYRKASVVVLPSVSDAYGNIVPEAMASGVPIVVTDRCGASEIVRNGVEGFVVPARDSDALRDRLLQLHGDPEMRLRMGAAGREAALALPWSNFRGDMNRILNEALGGRGAR